MAHLVGPIVIFLQEKFLANVETSNPLKKCYLLFKWNYFKILAGFCQDFMRFPGLKRLFFLCFEKARETSENVNNFVEYIFFGFSGFLLAQKKNTFSPGKCVKSFQICRDFRKRPLSLKKSTFWIYLFIRWFSHNFQY